MQTLSCLEPPRWTGHDVVLPKLSFRANNPSWARMSYKGSVLVAPRQCNGEHLHYVQLLPHARHAIRVDTLTNHSVPPLPPLNHIASLAQKWTSRQRGPNPVGTLLGQPVYCICGKRECGCSCHTESKDQNRPQARKGDIGAPLRYRNELYLPPRHLSYQDAPRKALGLPVKDLPVPSDTRTQEPPGKPENRIQASRGRRMYVIPCAMQQRRGNRRIRRLPVD